MPRYGPFSKPKPLKFKTKSDMAEGFDLQAMYNLNLNNLEQRVNTLHQENAAAA